jgi:hypothetical protein
MSRTRESPFDQYEWAAVCACGWAASNAGTNAGRHRIEQLGKNHDRECDDAVTLERRGADVEQVKQLEVPGA